LDGRADAALRAALECRRPLEDAAGIHSLDLVEHISHGRVYIRKGYPFLMLLSAPQASGYYPKIGMERFTDCFLFRRSE
jgi:hypothetical protein